MILYIFFACLYDCMRVTLAFNVDFLKHRVERSLYCFKSVEAV